MLLVPSLPAIYTIAEVEADPVRTNNDNGHYCNSMNLLDLCGIAIPTGLTVELENGLGATDGGAGAETTANMPFV